jgi:hypothetical protein
VGIAELSDTVVRKGIARPPFGVVDESSINSYGSWSWGSLQVDPLVMYMFRFDVIAGMLRDHGPFFAFAHAGHGTNSYGLNLVTAAGPIAAFVQHSYMGLYTDPVQSLIAINSTYSRLHVLLEKAKHKAEMPLRWMLLYSDFRGACTITEIDGPGTQRFDGEEALFKAATDLVRGQG